jgi:hypothetical protein
MRKLALCGVITVLGAATAAVALASSQATVFSFKQSARAPGASTGISFKVEFGDPDAANGLPSGLKDFKITMPKGAKIDPAGATQCKASNADIMSKEKASGKPSWLFLFLINDAFAAAFDAPVKGNTLSAKGLTGAVPGGLLVTKFSGTIAKHSKGSGKKKHFLITAPSVCPKSKKWNNKASWTFVDGSKDTSSSTSACKP